MDLLSIISFDVTMDGSRVLSDYSVVDDLTAGEIQVDSTLKCKPGGSYG